MEESLTPGLDSLHFIPPNLDIPFICLKIAIFVRMCDIFSFDYFSSKFKAEFLKLKLDPKSKNYLFVKRHSTTSNSIFEKRI